MFRSVGPACNPGIPHRVATPPLSEGPASLPPILPGRDGVSGVRNKSDADKTGNFSSRHPLGVAGFPFKHLLGAKKGWWAQTHNQPEKVKRIYSPYSLQDGRNPHAKRPVKTGRFYGEDRSEGRVLRGTNRREGQAIPEVQVEEQNVPIQLPTFWTVMRSLGLYQDNEGSSRDLERNGSQAHHLHRRHFG